MKDQPIARCAGFLCLYYHLTVGAFYQMIVLQKLDLLLRIYWAFHLLAGCSTQNMFLLLSVWSSDLWIGLWLLQIYPLILETQTWRRLSLDDFRLLFICFRYILGWVSIAILSMEPQGLHGWHLCLLLVFWFLCYLSLKPVEIGQLTKKVEIDSAIRCSQLVLLFIETIEFVLLGHRNVNWDWFRSLLDPLPMDWKHQLLHVVDIDPRFHTFSAWIVFRSSYS